MVECEVNQKLLFDSSDHSEATGAGGRETEAVRGERCRGGKGTARGSRYFSFCLTFDQNVSSDALLKG